MNKEAKRVYDKIYYESNKERIKTRCKVWRDAHPEKARTVCKAYRDAHPDEEKARHKAYRKANPTCNQEYYENNKERLKAVTGTWRKANPDKCRRNNRKRRALKQETQIEPINEKIVYLRDGWICQHCKKRVDKRLKYPNPISPSLDHIIPLTQGGTHTYNNVQLAHFGCNSSKRDRILPQGEQLRLC